MADLHIEDFYRDVAAIFIQLYNRFPRKEVLYVDDICGSNEPDEFGLPSTRYHAGFSAMVWLAEQGYLQYDSTIRQEALDQTALTEKGFLLLSSRSELDLGDQIHRDDIPPSVMEYSFSNIEQLRRAMESGSSITIKQCVHYLLSLTSN